MKNFPNIRMSQSTCSRAGETLQNWFGVSVTLVFPLKPFQLVRVADREGESHSQSGQQVQWLETLTGYVLVRFSDSLALPRASGLETVTGYVSAWLKDIKTVSATMIASQKQSLMIALQV